MMMSFDRAKPRFYRRLSSSYSVKMKRFKPPIYQEVERCKDGLLVLYDMRPRDEDIASTVKRCASLKIPDELE
jgi:hypothetical protein